MGLHTWLRDRRLRHGFAGSLFLHALLALLIPFGALTAVVGPQAVERISFARVTEIRLERPAHRAAATLRLPQRRAKSKTAPKPVHAELTAKTHASPRPQAHLAAAPAKSSQAAAPARSTAPLAQTATAPPSPAPVAASPAPLTHTPAPNSEISNDNGIADTGGVMPFGADLPVPVLDPRVHKQLEALAVHVTLVVVVGDDGRTKSVDFHPPQDPQIEAQIRSMLADANWDAAVCGGGITCQGTATIKL